MLSNDLAVLAAVVTAALPEQGASQRVVQRDHTSGSHLQIITKPSSRTIPASLHGAASPEAQKI